MRVFLCIRKVYVLLKTPNSESHWMIFDIETQHWTVFISDLNFVVRCCYGSILTIRNIHYYFHNDIIGSSPFIDPIVRAKLLSPIYRILDNGTSIDLESEIPIAKQYLSAMENSNGIPQDLSADLSIVQAPFYQRFYEEVQN